MLGSVEMFPGTLEPQDRLLYVVNRVIGFAIVDRDVFVGKPMVLLNAVMGLFGALALIAATIVLFQSQRAENALTGEDESAIRGLLELWGKNDSLGYFATRRDKSVVFAHSGRAAVTYRVEVGVCLASGDPVGDPRAWRQAVDAWLGLCQTYGWAPGVMGASTEGARVYREAGLNALELGDEAILRTADYKLSGPDMRGVRQAVTRARRAGPDGAHPPAPRHLPRRDGRHHPPRRRLARHPSRAWLFDGARPARRPRRRRLPAGRGDRPRRRRSSRCSRWCRGEPPASPWT